jgi:hypothetical protein
LAYIGNIPAESYASFETETFTVSATASYTLSHAVANENDIRLVINGVVQQPGSGKAYTASGTTLTLTSATVSGDSMYAVYLGRALQTVNPPNASVGNSQTAPTIITGQTAETSIATDDTILIHDTSASALRKMTRANFVSGIGGTNTPNFLVAKSGNQTLSSGTVTKISLGTEEYDSDNVFGSDKFTVPSGQGGKYNLFGNVQLQSDGTNKLLNAVVYIYINGSESSSQISRVSELYDSNDITRASMNFSFAINLSASDYVEIYASATHSTGGSIFARQESTYFGAYKIIE